MTRQLNMVVCMHYDRVTSLWSSCFLNVLVIVWEFNGLMKQIEAQNNMLSIKNFSLSEQRSLRKKVYTAQILCDLFAVTDSHNFMLNIIITRQLWCTSHTITF